MKIKTKELSFEEVMKLPRPAHRNPVRPSPPMRALLRAVSAKDLKDTGFTFRVHDMKDAENRPCLILMNHSSFIDLEMTTRIFRNRPYQIVCTSDGFVGKPGLMYAIGCIPTKKFVTDVGLISDISYALEKNHSSVLMYPEASYTFDGCATPLPRGLGVLIRRLKVPVIMVRTRGAFLRDPLYNCLQKRQVQVSADVSCLFSSEESQTLSPETLNQKLDEAFTFDNFLEQREQGILVTEPFRADGLNRILYRCAACGKEGQMSGKGTRLTCGCCGKQWTLEEDGSLRAVNGETEFSHIPDWYASERAYVRAALEDGSYLLDTPVKIGVMVDYKAIYMVGSGRLRHTADGFVLDGCGGKLHYEQGPLACYGLYSDYFWYELGDMICIGSRDALYYCFPEQADVAAKTRIAVEELYKMKKPARRSRQGE